MASGAVVLQRLTGALLLGCAAVAHAAPVVAGTLVGAGTAGAGARPVVVSVAGAACCASASGAASSSAAMVEQ